MKIFIYPNTDIYYSSFYYYGLEKKFGRRNIFFKKEPFKGIPLEEIFAVQMVLIADDGVNKRKIVIDAFDINNIRESLYNWCDVYGHCNANFSKYPKDKWPKLVSLCPSFGIRCWNIPQTIYHTVDNYIKLHFHIEPKFSRLAYRYYKQLLRVPYSFYEKVSSISSEKDFVFSINSLWYNNACCNHDDGVNLSRKLFFNACRSIPGINFRGGLVVRKRSSSQAYKFKGYLTDSVSDKKWLKETAKSAVVFNTPTCWQCHGWKFGEFLFLGKAIISTPLVNDLPEPMEHGENIHFVENNESSMREALEYILSHPEYRIKLENGAREYYMKWGTPEKSLSLLGL